MILLLLWSVCRTPLCIHSSYTCMSRVCDFNVEIFGSSKRTAGSYLLGKNMYVLGTILRSHYKLKISIFPELLLLSQCYKDTKKSCPTWIRHLPQTTNLPDNWNIKQRQPSSCLSIHPEPLQCGALPCPRAHKHEPGCTIVLWQPSSLCLPLTVHAKGGTAGTPWGAVCSLRQPNSHLTTRG